MEYLILPLPIRMLNNSCNFQCTQHTCGAFVCPSFNSQYHDFLQNFIHLQNKDNRTFDASIKMTCLTMIAKINI